MKDPEDGDRKYSPTINNCMNDPTAPRQSSEAISPMYMGCAVITNPTPRPWIKRAAYIWATLFVVTSSIYDRRKKILLINKVIFLPHLSAIGPAINGPGISWRNFIHKMDDVLVFESLNSFIK